MIHVERGSPPEGFEQRAKELARRLADARTREPQMSASEFWQRVRAELRADAAALAERFHHKCAFCESRMEHVQHPHIEHYRPKGRREFEGFMFDWQNWLFSCGRCNDSKWKHFPDCSGTPCLLNPTSDQPEEHLAFHRQEIEGLTDRGRETVRLLGLDRTPLSRERAAWLVKVETLLLLACLAAEQEIRGEARRWVIWCLQEEAPFCAMTRSYVSYVAPKLVKPVQPHPKVNESEGMQRIARLVEDHLDEIRQLA
jgi:uncharacterized protein (TIGR02646 family)